MTDVSRPLYRALLVAGLVATVFTAGCKKKPVAAAPPPPPPVHSAVQPASGGEGGLKTVTLAEPAFWSRAAVTVAMI